MKKLKYLKLFEAFESEKLSKTLKFINRVARNNFMQSLSKIATKFDFPISKFNDDMFEYLPFKSALRKNVPPPKEAEREVCNRESDWIRGEFCQGGRVKRTWGDHTRMVECPGCGGTGFKPLKKITPDVSLVKFWFDKDGNFVNVTGCDGVIRPQNPLVEEEAYNWNNLINLSSMYMSNYKDMEERLKNAHFAIILDLNRLKESEFQKLSLTKSERELRKAGAFLKPEQVKDANLERYLNLLIKKFDANKGLSELIKVIPRAFGYTNILTFALRGYNMRKIEDLITKLFIFMQNPTDKQDSIMSSLEDIYTYGQDTNLTINRTSDEVWCVLDKRDNEKEKKYFQTYQEISYLIYEKVSAEKIETLADIETLINKIKSLKNLIETTRYESVGRCVSNIASYLGSGYTNYVVNYIESAIDDYPNAQSELEEFKKMVEKTF